MHMNARVCKIWTKNSRLFGKNVRKCVLADGGHFAIMVLTGGHA